MMLHPQPHSGIIRIEHNGDEVSVAIAKKDQSIEKTMSEGEELSIQLDAGVRSETKRGGEEIKLSPRIESISVEKYSHDSIGGDDDGR